MDCSIYLLVILPPGNTNLPANKRYGTLDSFPCDIFTQRRNNNCATIPVVGYSQWRHPTSVGLYGVRGSTGCSFHLVCYIDSHLRHLWWCVLLPEHQHRGYGDHYASHGHVLCLRPELPNGSSGHVPDSHDGGTIWGPPPKAINSLWNSSSWN